MNVVIVSDSAKISGGAEKVALTSAIALAQSGNHVVVFAGTGPADEKLLNVPNLELAVTGHTPFYDQPGKLDAMRQALWNQEAAAKFIEATSSLDPAKTIVHFHSYLRVLSASVLGAALDAGFPVVVTLHDYGLACPNMGFYNYQTNQICHLRPLSAACVCTKCTIRGYVNKLGLVARGVVLNKRVHWARRIKRFVSVSQRSGEIMRPFISPSATIDLVLNPVDVGKGSPVDVAANKNVLFVGKLDPQKDPVRLANAAREEDMPVVFVGEGPLREEVMAANPGATITGWVAPSEVRQAQRSARFLVMTSRWYEAAPLVIFDALAAGLPVVLPSTCAGCEFITHRETGLIFDPEKIDDLERCLSDLKDDQLVSALGAEAYRRFWLDPPTMDRHIEQLTGIYTSMLS